MLSHIHISNLGIIEDLEIDHQVKNLKYKFSKIKKYLKVCGI